MLSGPTGKGSTILESLGPWHSYAMLPAPGQVGGIVDANLADPELTGLPGATGAFIHSCRVPELGYRFGV